MHGMLLRHYKNIDISGMDEDKLNPKIFLFLVSIAF